MREVIVSLCSTDEDKTYFHRRQIKRAMLPLIFCELQNFREILAEGSDLH